MADDLKVSYEEVLRSYLNDLEKDDDGTVRGFIESEENYVKFRESLLQLGVKFVTRTSKIKGEGQSAAQNKGCPILFSNKKGVSPIEFFGQPFIIKKNTANDCKFGRNYHKYKLKKQHGNKFSKKHDCPASMHVKEVWVFMSERYTVIATNSRFKMENAQKNSLRALHADLEDNNALHDVRFYIQVSSLDSHDHTVSRAPEPQVCDVGDEMYNFEHTGEIGHTVEILTSSPVAKTQNGFLETEKKRVLDMIDHLKNLIDMSKDIDVIEETKHHIEEAIKLQQLRFDVAYGGILGNGKEASRKRSANGQSCGQQTVSKRKRRCGTCGKCQVKVNCGKCEPCLSKKLRKTCDLRKCENMIFIPSKDFDQF